MALLSHLPRTAPPSLFPTFAVHGFAWFRFHIYRPRPRLGFGFTTFWPRHNAIAADADDQIAQWTTIVKNPSCIIVIYVCSTYVGAIVSLYIDWTFNSQGHRFTLTSPPPQYLILIPSLLIAFGESFFTFLCISSFSLSFSALFSLHFRTVFLTCSRSWGSKCAPPIGSKANPSSRRPFLGALGLQNAFGSKPDRKLASLHLSSWIIPPRHEGLKNVTHFYAGAILLQSFCRVDAPGLMSSVIAWLWKTDTHWWRSSRSLFAWQTIPADYCLKTS